MLIFDLSHGKCFILLGKFFIESELLREGYLLGRNDTHFNSLLVRGRKEMEQVACDFPKSRILGSGKIFQFTAFLWDFPNFLRKLLFRGCVPLHNFSCHITGYGNVRDTTDLSFPKFKTPLKILICP